MTNIEKLKRINSAMIETEGLLERAIKKYNDTITCLKMDIEENKEFGNDKLANRAWVDYALQDKARVKELQAHKQMLLNMEMELRA